MQRHGVSSWFGVWSGLSALVVIGVLLPALPAPVSALQQESSPEITFAGDVAEILQQNCQVCHRPGAIGPMSLLTYEEVRPWAPMIRDQVLAREMPPYHYDTDVGIQRLKEDKRLTEEDIRTIVAWVDAGAPFGREADLPAPVEWPDPAEWRLASRLGPPDLIVPSDPFDVPASGQGSI